jgi:diamine N-acetyltransferase
VVATLRAATPADLAALLVLQRRYYSEDGYPWDEPAARSAASSLLEEPSLGRVWMVEEGGEAVGYFVLTFGYSLEYRGRDAFVDELYFGQSHRGRGLGREALRMVEEACRAEGVRALHLEVERDKPSALGLYRSAGFEDHDRYLMTKRLERPPET